MRINRKHRILFFHIPRTSGKKVATALQSEVLEHDWHRIPINFNKLSDYKDYKKFTIVRNPIRRFFSFYYRDVIRENKEESFLDWFIRIKDQPLSKPQHQWYTINGEIVLDRIFRYEDLAKNNYNDLKEYIGPWFQISPAAADDINRANIEDYITEEITNHIINHDQVICDLFNYKDHII